MGTMVTPRISDDMSAEPPSARWLVRELVSRAATRSKTPDDVASVAFDACEHTYRALARELGTASAQALVNRAQAQAGLTHPALRGVRLYRQRDSEAPATAIAMKADCSATADEFELWLEALIALLGRFVGINIVTRLVAPLTSLDTTPKEGAR